MEELSIFIDESGDFGAYNPKSPFYIIGMVMHNQSNDISENIKRFDSDLKRIGYVPNYIHVGPLIRRKAEYKSLDIQERLKILRRLDRFSRHIDFSYTTFMVEKKHIDDEAVLVSRLAKQMSEFIKQNLTFFLQYNSVKIYYDNGQVEVTKIIISVFTSLLDKVELKKAFPIDYKLSQIADMVCTYTLTELKMKSKTLSCSERRLLGSDKAIEKYYLKPLKRKKFKD